MELGSVLNPKMDEKSYNNGLQKICTLGLDEKAERGYDEGTRRKIKCLLSLSKLKISGQLQIPGLLNLARHSRYWLVKTNLERQLF
jgi:hypothetical protein